MNADPRTPAQRVTVRGRREGNVRRGVPGLLVMLAIAVAGYLWHGMVHRAWGGSLLVLLVSVGAAIAFSRTIASGHARTTWGEFMRGHHSYAFWLTVVLCFLVYVGSVATLFFAQPFSSP